jgi:hypothetical protein
LLTIVKACFRKKNDFTVARHIICLSDPIEAFLFVSYDLNLVARPVSCKQTFRFWVLGCLD